MNMTTQGDIAAQRWLGVDHGTKRIGVAAGSAGDGFASPLEVIAAQPEAAAIRRILELAKEYQAAGIVVGLPLNMDDSEGPQAQIVREMAGELAAATELPVLLWDERLSSFVADESLAGTLTRKKRKARQDAVAAAAILRDFLESGGPTSPRVRKL